MKANEARAVVLVAREARTVSKGIIAARPPFPTKAVRYFRGILKDADVAERVAAGDAPLTPHSAGAISVCADTARTDYEGRLEFHEDFDLTAVDIRRFKAKLASVELVDDLVDSILLPDPAH